MINVKQELKAVSENLQHHKRIMEGRTISKNFNHNQAMVYRDIGEGAVNIIETPSWEDIDSFWRKTWSKVKKLKEDTLRLEEIWKSYCFCVTSKTYNIDGETLANVILKLRDKKAPGGDLIAGYLYKKLTPYQSYFVNL